MPSGYVDLAGADGAVPAFEAIPDFPSGGGVVVVQEAFGITTYIEETTSRLAENGWHAVAPALFHREGSPVVAYDDIAAVMPIMGKVTAEGISHDVDAAISHLAQAGIEESRVGIVGFCMGGSVAFHTAASRPVGAAVTFYGGGVVQGRFGLPSLVERARELKAPWLGLYGGLDKGIPVDQVDALRDATRGAEVETEVVLYPDADHGFHCHDREKVYDADAAADGWKRTLGWFDEHIGGPNAA